MPRFKRAGRKEDDAPEEDAEVPPEDDDGAGAPGSVHPPGPDPIAYFAPSDMYRRPSDYVAHLTRLFEAGTLDPRTNRREPKPLKRDQALFVTQFAAACNAVNPRLSTAFIGSPLLSKSRSCSVRPAAEAACNALLETAPLLSSKIASTNSK